MLGGMSYSLYMYLAQESDLQAVESLCRVESAAMGDGVPAEATLVADFLEQLPEAVLDYWWEGEGLLDWFYCDEVAGALPPKLAEPLQGFIAATVGHLDDADPPVCFNDATQYPGIPVGPAGEVDSIMGPARVRQLMAIYDQIDMAGIAKHLKGDEARDFTYIRQEVLPAWRDCLQQAADAQAYLLVFVTEDDDDDFLDDDDSQA